MSHPLTGIFGLIFMGYVLLNGVLFLLVPQEWGRSKWSFYPRQFLYLLDAPLGRLMMRAVGLVFIFVSSDFLIFMGSPLVGIPMYFQPLNFKWAPWGVILVLTGLASLIAPNWMLDPKAHPQNRRLLGWLGRASGVLLLLVGIHLLARSSEPGLPAGLSTLSRQGGLAVIMILLGYLTLSGAMFFLAPRWWSTSGFAPAIFGDSAELEKPEVLARVRLRGLVMGSVGLVILINIILFF